MGRGGAGSEGTDIHKEEGIGRGGHQIIEWYCGEITNIKCPNLPLICSV